MSTLWNGVYYGDLELPSSIREKNIVAVMPHYFTSGVAVNMYINTSPVDGMTSPTLRIISTTSRSAMNFGVDYYYTD